MKEKGNETGSWDGLGDCYEAAAHLVVFPFSKLDRETREGLFLCHGTVTGQGPLEGVEYGHAWAENEDTVFDYSNGRELELDKDFYYKLGHVRNVKRYTKEEARKKLLEFEHYGPWEEEDEG